MKPSSTLPEDTDMWLEIQHRIAKWATYGGAAITGTLDWMGSHAAGISALATLIGLSANLFFAWRKDRRDRYLKRVQARLTQE